MHMHRENGIQNPFKDIFSLAIALVVLLQTTKSIASEQGSREVKQILENLFAQYDKSIRPNYGEKPVEVGISVYVISIDGLNEDDMTLTLKMYFRQNWRDPRLVFRPQRGINHNGSNSTIVLDSDRAKSLWVPDTFFTNENKAWIHDTTMLNEFVRINTSGNVLKSTRITVKFACPMDLRHFPFDKQTCSVDLESFSGTMNEIIYRMGNESLSVSDEATVPGFKFVGQYIRAHEISLTAGNYSRVSLRFVFQRAFGYYILRCYVPIGTAVTVSLLALLFANPAIGPLIHVVNICFVIWYSAQAWILKSPMVSYIKSLDLYFFVCLGHLILSLFLSLASSYQQNKQNYSGNSVCSICKPLTEMDTYRGSQNVRRTSPCNAGSIIFCCLKWLVVILFVVTNVLYWLFYRYVTIVANKKYEQGTTFT